MELECLLFLLVIVTILGCTCAVNISTTEKINHLQWFYHENMKSYGAFMVDRYRKDAIEHKEYMTQLDEKLNILFEDIAGEKQGRQ